MRPTGVAAQAIRRPGRAGIGDVPVDLVGGGSKRLHQSLGYRTSEQIEAEYYANQAVQAVSL